MVIVTMVVAVFVAVLMTVVVMIAPRAPGLVAVAVGMLVRCRPVIHGQILRPPAVTTGRAAARPR